MKRFFYLFLTTVVLACAAGCSSDSDGSDAELQAAAGRIATLEEQVRSLTEAIASLQRASEAADRELLTKLTEQQMALEQADQALWEAIRAIPDAPDPSDFAELRSRLEQLEATVLGTEASSGLAEQIAAVRSDLESRIEQGLAAKLEKSQVEAMLLELEIALQTQITALGDRIDACEELVHQLSVNAMQLQNQLDAMQSVLGSKVDAALYEEFVRQTNDKIQTNAAALAALQALCSGFDGEGSIRAYIDAAKSDVLALLGNYALQSTYEAFYAEYLAFCESFAGYREQTDSKLAALQQLLEGLQSGGGDASLADLLELTSRIEQLEAKAHALTDVYALFDKENAQFLSGVNGVLEAALDEGGVISAALAEQAATLRAAYEEALGDLGNRLKELEERVGDLEDQVSDLIDRIQSLVYVPKTSDGLIHIGTTYIAQPDENGNDAGPRIEVTPTKKLEYRVSPAALRDKLLQLPLEAFAFYQEHVSRAEGDGLDEFHIRAVEAGNGPGEILLTVHSDHDFTHQDLAVALCIKAVSANGVPTEFTSPYTTVVGDGRNIWDRFYLARKTAAGYEPARDDLAVYLIRYDDTSTPVPFLGDYELVYDNGESCMSLTEAKERFEWQIDLSESRTALAGSFKNPITSYTTSTPAYPNSERAKSVTVRLNSATTHAIGKAVTDSYRIAVSDGSTSVTLMPEFRVSLVVCSDSYRSGAASLHWSYDKWAAATGAVSGSASYTTTSVSITDSRTSTNDLSYLPDKVVSELFAAADVAWTVQQEASVPDELTARVGTVAANGTRRNWNFIIDGYVYSEGASTLTLSGTTAPASLVSGSIALEASVSIDAPAARSAVAVDAEMTTKQTPNDAACQLFYLSGNTALDADKKPYTAAEITKYFGGVAGNVSLFFARATLNAKTWMSADGRSLPVSVMSLRSAANAATMISTLAAEPMRISPAITSATTFAAPAGCTLTVPHGPTIPITGTIRVVTGE